MIEAEFEEIDEVAEKEDRLDLSEDDSLPWLESDDEADAGGGYDITQFVGLAVILLALLGAMVGGIWFLSNTTSDKELVADGSTIEAPEGPYKVKPDDPGGKTFDGTGNVAPAVGEGQTRDGKLAEEGDAGDESASGSASDGGDDVARPSVDTRSTDEGAGAAASSSTVGVQVGAYGSQARAEEGWAELTRSSAALEGVRYRIVKGQADIGTVYRLQALAADGASADRLCKALKADGLPCQVKR